MQCLLQEFAQGHGASKCRASSCVRILASGDQDGCRNDAGLRCGKLNEGITLMQSPSWSAGNNTKTPTILRGYLNVPRQWKLLLLDCKRINVMNGLQKRFYKPITDVHMNERTDRRPSRECFCRVCLPAATWTETFETWATISEERWKS